MMTLYRFPGLCCCLYILSVLTPSFANEKLAARSQQQVATQYYRLALEADEQKDYKVAGLAIDRAYTVASSAPGSKDAANLERIRKEYKRVLDIQMEHERYIYETTH